MADSENLSNRAGTVMKISITALALSTLLLSTGGTAAATSAPVNCADGGELMDQVALPGNGGALALWKSYRVGGYCAEATGSATGTVAIENIDGSILTFAVKTQPNSVIGTEWVNGLVPIRGVFNSNGATTVTPWHSSV